LLLLKISILITSAVNWDNMLISLAYHLEPHENDDIKQTPLPLLLLFYIFGEVIPSSLILVLFERMPSAQHATRFNEFTKLLPDDKGSGTGKDVMTPQNPNLIDKYTCKICMVDEVNTVLLPCKHSLLCHNCASKVETCPICRIEVGNILKYYPG